MDKRVILWIMGVMICLWSCETEQEFIVDPDVTIGDTLDVPPPVRKAISLKINDKSKGSKYGVYMNASSGRLLSSGNVYDNLCLCQDGDSLTAADPFLWPDEENAYDFTIYSPYVTPIEEVSGVPFAVESDQRSEESYSNSNFMWGTVENISAETECPSVNLKHLFCQVKVVFNLAESPDYRQLDVTLNNTQTNTYINLADGVVVPVGDVHDIFCLHADDDSYHAILIPQSFTNTQFITVDYKGESYTYNGSLDMQAGKTYTLTLKSISQAEIKLIVSVEDWIPKESIEDKCEEEL